MAAGMEGLGRGWAREGWGGQREPRDAGRRPPVVLEVREVVEDVGVRLALGEGEARVSEVAEHLLHVRVDPGEGAGPGSRPAPSTYLLRDGDSQCPRAHCRKARSLPPVCHENEAV